MDKSATPIVKIKSEITFDFSEALTVLSKCLETLRMGGHCDLVLQDFAESISCLQDALDWIKAPVKTQKELNQLAKIENATKRAQEFASKTQRLNIENETRAILSKIRLSRSILISGKVIRDYSDSHRFCEG